MRKLIEIADDPFLASWYPQIKRETELAQELFGLDEDAWIDLQDRVVIARGVATRDDIERFEQVKHAFHEERRTKAAL